MTRLSDAAFQRRLYGAAAIMVAVPPLVGGTMMGLAGYYPLPDVYRALFSYTGLYILAVAAPTLWSARALARHLLSLTSLPVEAAAARLRRILRPMPLYLLLLLSAHAVTGVLTVDASLVALGWHPPWGARERLAHVVGAAIPVLATALPLFFHLGATMDRYFAPRRIIAVATSLHVKLLVSCLVAPLFVDIMLLAYFTNYEGAIDPVALCIWVVMLGFSVAAFLFGRADLNRVLSPLQGLGSGQQGLARAAAPLQPMSLDELGLVTSRLLERIAAEDRLRRDIETLNERLTQAVHATGLGVFDHDLRGDMLHWTSGMFRMLGVPEIRRARVQLYVDAIHADDRQRADLEFARAYDPSGTGRYDIEHRILRPDGTVRWLSVHAQTYFADVDGTRVAARVVGAMVDITERKLLEEHRRALEEELQEARRLEAVGTFASGIAHDFNNILAVVSGNLDLARHAIPRGHAAAEPLRLIDLAARRGADLTAQLSLFARGQRQTSLATPIAPLIQDAVRLLQSTAAPGASIEVHVHDPRLTVWSCPGQLQQVIGNLVTNALQSLGTRGGTVSVDLRRAAVPDAAGTAPLSCLPGAYAVIAVTDSGCGMTEEIRARIFEPFFTTRLAGGGSGLGLAVVDAIVRSLGGAIVVRSAPGSGSAFEVWLPLQGTVSASATAAEIGLVS